MEYRKLTRGGEKISIIGLGTSSVGTADAKPFAAFGRTTKSIRDKVYFQVHFGADYETGNYGWTVNLDKVKKSIDWQLLNANTSPFRQALSEYQCIQYALDKPGVLTVLPGIRGKADLKRILGFCNAAPQEKDYSILGTFAPQDAAGVCVYCNHCQPCPAGLDVGLINKYYDLARAGDELAYRHYEKLETKADACIGCGHCDTRCPFHVVQTERMKEIHAYFG